MKHRQLMSGVYNKLAVDPLANCGGEASYVKERIFGGAPFGLFLCDACGEVIAAYRNGVHPFNCVIDDPKIVAEVKNAKPQ